MRAPLILALLAGCAGGKPENELNSTDTADTADPGCEESEWYADGDLDGYGGGEAVLACEPPGEGFIAAGGDCDDAADAVNPGADELCDGADNDCDGDVDGGAIDATTMYLDADGDGFGGDASVACEQPAGVVENADDCDDADAGVNPGASEVCDGLDNDCDELVDQDDKSLDTSTLTTFYADSDGDSYGDAGAPAQACLLPLGHVENDLDCDDADAKRYEGCFNSPVVASADCTLSTWAAPEPADPELHIVTVYEGDGGHGGPPGNITVDIERETEMVLILSSYEPVNWTVNAVAGAKITEIVHNGYNDHTVTVPGSSPTITDRSGFDPVTGSPAYWAACAYVWPFDTGGCDTPELVLRSESYSGLTLSSFTGCYHGTQFTLK